ncbi:MAG TPA: RsmB/NOP family class I SAM-dependent RNA methyltransferase [Acidimicrobiia bacterium]
MKPGVASRAAAAEVVRRVTDDGAFSNVVLDDLDSSLSPADSTHARRLTMDALRRLRIADEAIAAASNTPPDELEASVRAILRVAVAEMAGGAAAHAAVDNAVEAVRAAGSPRAAGFVNAVLRSVLRAGVPEATPRAETPPWMFEQLERSWGTARAEAFFAAGSLPPKPSVRIRSEALAHEPTGVPGSGYVEAAALGEIARSGTGVIVDPASVAVSSAVAAEPGMRVLDMAAAPGGKTSHLWDQMSGSGLLVALDIHVGRLASAKKRLARLGMRPAWLAGDGRRPALRQSSFDRVLLDAPCTGLGTLRRRPEIRHRLDPSSPARMAAIQEALLRSAVRLAGPGGRVVYSVCTVFADETVDIVRPYDAAPPPGLPGEPWEKGLLLAPHTTATDGMFISVITPRG